MEEQKNENKCTMCHGECAECAICPCCGKEHMENKGMGGKGMMHGMGYGMCRMGCCGMRFRAIRWIIMIAILVSVFYMGVKVGEFRGAIYGSDYGYYPMMRFSSDRIPAGTSTVYGPGMMWGIQAK